jgi:hypothetical protein
MRLESSCDIALARLKLCTLCALETRPSPYSLPGLGVLVPQIRPLIGICGKLSSGQEPRTGVYRCGAPSFSIDFSSAAGACIAL